MSPTAIDIQNVSKRYSRRVQALCGIDLRINRGEVFGLLGPNGAGKSTLVKILMTVVRPTHAEGTLLGKPLGHKPTLAQVGYLPEHHRLPNYLTALQALDFFAALCKTDRATRKRRAAELLVKVGLERWGRAKVNTFSKGMQQRLGLAIALVHDPQLVVLDEPTDGLDPVGRREVRQLLQQLKSEGKTIFINSHLLSEVEQICDRVAILAGGKIVRQGSIDELTVKSQRFEITMTASSETAPERLKANILAALPWPFAASSPDDSLDKKTAETLTGRLPTGEIIELSGNKLCVVTHEAAPIQPVIDALRKANLTIESVGRVRDSLEDSFFGILADSAGQTSTGGAAGGEKK